MNKRGLIFRLIVVTALVAAVCVARASSRISPGCEAPDVRESSVGVKAQTTSRSARVCRVGALTPHCLIAW